MAKHKVNWHLHMGKTEHHAGDEIDLPAEQAAPLVGFGVLTPLGEDEVTPQVEDFSPSQLAKMSKDQLAVYAKAKYSTVLNPADMTKDAMLAALAVCAADEAKQPGLPPTGLRRWDGK
jgi:hypothetical protein